ncbi:glycosyl transferase family 90-domain-containing protein [Mycena crocata]|nr:glycosyl transferase family 90-domain-containing protein [Mycena crocata]
MLSHWGTKLFQRSYLYDSHPNDDNHPLLPLNDIRSGDEAENGHEVRTLEQKRSGWRLWMRQHARLWWLATAVMGFLALIAMFMSRAEGTLTRDLKLSNINIAELYAHQSSTLAQAMARYTLRNNRAPPPMYDQWYRFARGHSCLIDAYEQISRDFEPFYQIAQQDPTYFKKMVEKASLKARSVQKDGGGMKTGTFRHRKFTFTDGQGTLYTDDWPRTFARFSSFMPNMNVVLNGRDEPRVIFNYRKFYTLTPPQLNISDPIPFEHSPHPTASFFKNEMHCVIPNRPKGFTGPANDASAFMQYSSSTQFTTDLYPVLSMTKISPCFADILVPSEFYYSDSNWTPHYKYTNNIAWENKIPKLYWRGMTSGGWVYDDNYHAFPRFRVVDIGRSHQDIMDVAFSAFHESLCGERCDGDKIKAEYNITGGSFPREDVYRYKFAFDTDGNSFSGRYLGLLRSGSLVFKSTVFEEYFNDWLRPFQHYIPVLPDLSDLVDKIKWAIEHDAEAHAIQQAGKAFADYVITDAQNDCYFSAVLLEWGRLQAMADDIGE